MKSSLDAFQTAIDESLPVWGEWIEIQASCALMKASESLPVWGEWIEIAKL